MEQRAVEILRNDPQMRMEFLKLRGGSHRAHPIRVRLDSLMTAQRGVQDKHTRHTRWRDGTMQERENASSDATKNRRLIDTDIRWH